MTIPNVCFDHNKAVFSELDVIRLESLYAPTFPSTLPEKPHRLNFFNLVYIESGHGEHMVDFQRYAFKPGSIILIQPQQVQAFDFKNKPTGFILLFTETFLDRVHTNMRLPHYTPTHLNKQHSPFIQLDIHTHERAQRLFHELAIESAHEQAEPLLVMYLFSALSLLIERVKPQVRYSTLSEEQRDKLRRFFACLHQHCQQMRDANWYAQQVNTTYKTLNQICKTAMSMTAKQCIDAYAIVEIKRTLMVNHCNSQQMAYQFGFEDASNFVKYFKKHTQLTPGQFQKQQAC